MSRKPRGATSGFHTMLCEKVLHGGLHGDRNVKFPGLLSL